MANQFSNRPPFCDFLEKYQAVYKKQWKKSHYRTERVGLGRFDEWLKICPYELEDLDWNKLLEFHRFLSIQGISTRACRRSVEISKKVLRWGIETGQLPQKREDIYTSQFSRHHWDVELPPLSKEFLSKMEATRQGAYRSHRHSHRVFHTFLKENNLTYRRIRPEHMVTFVKYLHGKGFKLQTRATLPNHIKSYLRWLYQKKKMSRRADDLIPRGIIAKKPKNLPRPIDPEIDQRMQKILEETNDQIFKAILLIRRTGMRISECRKLQYDCIEYDIKKRATLKVPTVKLGIERRVPLDVDTIKVIKYLQTICLKYHKKKTLPKELIINSKGVPHRYEVFSDALTDICTRLNVKKWINLHALRHTYATSLLSAGMSIVSLKEVLGHKSLNMSLLYAKITPEKVHKEYMFALENMNEQQVPNLLNKKEVQLGDSFNDIHLALNKAIDNSSNEIDGKKIKLLLNRLAKIKMDIKKLPSITGMD